MKRNILVFFVILLINTAFMLIRNISSLDELWNYNFARNICDGLLPYKEISIIQMPLYPTIVALFLKLIANELIISRVVAILLFTLTMFVGYKILDKLIDNKWLPIIGILGILLIYKAEYWGDYNFAVLLITMITIFLEVKNNKGKILDLNVKYDFFIGIFVGLAIITKQTTGLILAFTFVIYKWLLIRNKQDFILAFKISLIRGIGVLVPIFAFIAYLLFTNTMSDFIDYSLKGMSTFSNSFPYEELLKHPDIKFIFKVIGVLVPILFIINAIVFFKTKNMNLFVLLIFSIQNMIVVYPLCDVVHFLIGALPILITTIYVIYILFGKFIKEEANKLLAVISIVMIIVVSGYSVFTLGIYIKNSKDDLNHFWGIPVKENTYNAMKELTQYITEQEKQGKKVYVLHLEAVLPMIILDKYNKNFDMLLEGNIGSRGEDGVIEDIKQMENAIFLIETTPSRNRQSTEKIRTFVQENYEQIGTILNYGIFI